MNNTKEKKCRYCDATLSKDEIGLNKKLFAEDSKKKLFMCYQCMADVLECTVDELKEKVEDFKREGCKLFS